MDNKKVLFAFIWMSSPSNLMTVLFGLWQPTFFFFGHLGFRSICCETKCAAMVKQSPRILNAQLIISNLERKKKEDETPTDGAGDKFTGFVKKRVGEREGERKSGLRDYDDSSPLPLYAE